MACTPPGSLSRGYVFFDYVVNDYVVPHRCRLRLVGGVDPTDLPVIFPAIDELCNRVAFALPNNARVLNWGTMNSDGSTIWTQAFSPVKAGVHPDGSGSRGF
jgi:hypothetical protein